MKCKVKKSWVNLEMEHTKSRNVARKIVGDHLREFGCAYYPEIFKLEKKMKRG